ncbi:late embryogeneis abundant protein 47 [Capsicum chacoense]|uniref:late embryogenesis abundant protein 47 n=1 Tax=Capsicum annuum TaxID=4072 RepID=UPI0007BF2652|nr:late embryogenesis abundant protein 47 [Capsicum annuum]KAF3614047.1 Late embryogenesis abundant protein D-34 [Capsicum annuum]
MSQEQPRREEAEQENESAKQEDVQGSSVARKQFVADSIGGQALDKDRKQLSPESVSGRANITIGEALEATVVTAGHRPVDYSDAAAIQAAEVRATGRTNIIPGGVAAAAQSAATRNARLTKEEEKTKLAEILAEASSKLPSDKPVTRKDAEGVIGAELRNDPNLCTRPGGVAASIAAAARLNQTNSTSNTTNGTKNNDKNSTSPMKQKLN